MDFSLNVMREWVRNEIKRERDRERNRDEKTKRKNRKRRSRKVPRQNAMTAIRWQCIISRGRSRYMDRAR